MFLQASERLFPREGSGDQDLLQRCPVPLSEHSGFGIWFCPNMWSFTAMWPGRLCSLCPHSRRPQLSPGLCSCAVPAALTSLPLSIGNVIQKKKGDFFFFFFHKCMDFSVTPAVNKGRKLLWNRPKRCGFCVWNAAVPAAARGPQSCLCSCVSANQCWPGCQPFPNVCALSNKTREFSLILQSVFHLHYFSGQSSIG